MSEKGGFDLVMELRFLVARFAVWFCGCPVLFWTAPEEWEEYISLACPVGSEPYKATEES